MKMKLPTETATGEQRTAVKHWITKAYGHPNESCVTGILVSEGVDEIVIRMYSAGCVHELYRIDRDDLIRVEDSPRDGSWPWAHRP